MLNLTESAVVRIKEVLSQQDLSGAKLRIFVEGGGCSGFQYGFIIEDNPTDGSDFEFDYNNVKLLVDPISAQYIDGITIDFKDDIEGARFVMSNPNAKTTCGCGSSFSPY
jgi:iron-sulfur cluster insertion protein